MSLTAIDDLSLTTFALTVGDDLVLVVSFVVDFVVGFVIDFAVGLVVDFTVGSIFGDIAGFLIVRALLVFVLNIIGGLSELSAFLALRLFMLIIYRVLKC